MCDEYTCEQYAVEVDVGRDGRGSVRLKGGGADIICYLGTGAEGRDELRIDIMGGMEIVTYEDGNFEEFLRHLSYRLGHDYLVREVVEEG